MSTVTVTPLTPAAAAQLVNCPQCWKVPGGPCRPWGSHLARYQRANRRGLLSYDPSWLRLVRTSAAAGNGFEGLSEVVGEGVGGGDGLSSGLDLDGAVAAGGLDEFPD